MPTALRLDHTLNQRVTLFARGSHTPSTQVSQNFSAVEYDSLNTDMVTAGATATFTPTKVNDFRFSWGRSSGKVFSTLINSYGTVPSPDSAIYQPGGNFSNTQPTILFPVADQELQVGTRSASERMFSGNSNFWIPFPWPPGLTSASSEQTTVG